MTVFGPLFDQAAAQQLEALAEAARMVREVGAIGDRRLMREQEQLAQQLAAGRQRQALVQALADHGLPMPELTATTTEIEGQLAAAMRTPVWLTYPLRQGDYFSYGGEGIPMRVPQPAA